MSRKFALIVGNSEYTDEKFTCLKTPDADVRGLAEVLREPTRGGFDDVQTLINKSDSEIKRATERFFLANKKPDDLLLYYFSGHGVLDDQGLLYLAAKDTEYELWSASAIPAGFITYNMDRSPSKRQILILDCCHSGAFSRGSKAVTGAKAVHKSTFEGNGRGKVVLTATDTTQYAWVSDDVIGDTENSVFTHFLIDGLRNGVADTNNDGEITLDELYEHVYKNLAGTKQTPRKWAYDQQGDIVIAANPFPSVNIAQLSADLLEALEHSNVFVREGAVLELEGLLKGSKIGYSLAAREALERVFVDDDSNKVKKLASDILVRYDSDRCQQLCDEAEAAIAKSEWKIAADKFEAVLKLQPDHAEAAAKLELVNEQQATIKIATLYNQAEAAITKSNWGAAIDNLKSLLELHPGHTDAEAKLSFVCKQQETEKEEKENRIKIIQLLTDANAALAKSDWETAGLKLQAVLLREPGHTEAVAKLEKTKAQQDKEDADRSNRIKIAELERQAQTAESSEDWRTASAKWQGLLLLDPTRSDVVDKIAYVEQQQTLAGHYAEGQRFNKDRNWSLALDRFKKVQEQNADYKDVGTLIANVRNELDRNSTPEQPRPFEPNTHTSNSSPEPDGFDATIVLGTPLIEERVLWPWVLGGSIVLILIIIVAVNNSSSGGDGPVSTPQRSDAFIPSPQPSSAASPTPTPTPTVLVNISEIDFRNFKYEFGDTIIVSTDGNMVKDDKYGDLTRDGISEAAIYVVRPPGGGMPLYSGVAVYQLEDGELKQIATRTCPFMNGIDIVDGLLKIGCEAKDLDSRTFIDTFTYRWNENDQDFVQVGTHTRRYLP